MESASDTIVLNNAIDWQGRDKLTNRCKIQRRSSIDKDL